MYNQLLNFPNDFGRWWLGGAKYEFSKKNAGAEWSIGIEPALNRFGMTLSNCNTLQDIPKVFAGKFFWVQDGFYALHDTVKPPIKLLNEGGDDCDGWAMTHAQAVAYVLGSRGWKAYTVSYLADPWWMSHHFCAAVDPQGKVWAIQPQPTAQQFKEHGAFDIVSGPYASVQEAVGVIAGTYDAKVKWWDQRGPSYDLLP